MTFARFEPHEQPEPLVPTDTDAVGYFDIYACRQSIKIDTRTDHLYLFVQSPWIEWLACALSLSYLADNVDKFLIMLLKRVENIDNTAKLLTLDCVFEGISFRPYPRIQAPRYNRTSWS